jgi:hypothetical protein
MTGYDDFAKAAQEAEERSQLLNFGKLTIGAPRYVRFKRDAGGNFQERLEVTAEQYHQLVSNPATKEEMQYEVNFEIDVKEFNPNLSFDYQRYVAIKGGKSDWNKVVKPSLETILGKAKVADFGGLLDYLNGKYVQVADVPQVRKSDFNTIEFKAIYNNQDECFQAWNEVYGGRVGRPSATAEGTVDTATAIDFPSSVYPTYQDWLSAVPGIKQALAQPDANPAKIAGDYAVTPNYIIKVRDGDYD